MTLLAPSSTVATSPQHAAAIAAWQAKIDQALSQRGATGPKGFLIWVRAAWPKPIADKILAAAAKHQAASAAKAASGPLGRFSSLAKVGMGSGVGSYMGPTTFGSVSERRGKIVALSAASRDRRAGMGSYSARARRAGLGSLGDTSSALDSLASSMGADIQNTPITVSADPTIANASTGGASSSWLSSIGTAVSAATQAYLGIQQSKDAQTLFDTNLQRAQAGLAPLNANPTAYGITSPTVNVGLSPGVQSLAIYGGLGLLGVFAFSAIMKHRK